MSLAKAVAVNAVRTIGSAILFFSLMVVFHLGYGIFRQGEYVAELKTGALIASAMITSVVFVWFFYFVYQVVVLTVGKQKRLFAFFVPLVLSMILVAAGGYLYFLDATWRGSETGVGYLGYGAVGAVFSYINYRVFIR